MNYTTLRNVLATLSAIIRAFPAAAYSEEDVPWRQTMVNVLYDMLAHPSYTIRSASAAALAAFSDKVREAKVVESVSLKIRGVIFHSLEKKAADAAGALDNAGYLVALSALWGSAAGQQQLEDVQSVISTVSLSESCVTFACALPIFFSQTPTSAVKFVHMR